MKRKNVIVLLFFLVVVIVASVTYFYKSKLCVCNNILKQEEIENQKEQELLKEDFYANRMNKLNEIKKSELEEERMVSEQAISSNIPDLYQTNFYSDKKEILSIENIESKNDFIEKLNSNIMMFLDYYNISITAEEINKLINFTELKKIDDKLVGDSPDDSCIIFEDENFIGCTKLYIEKILSKILFEKSPDNCLGGLNEVYGRNINYAVLDIPVIIWVGNEFQEAKEILKWYSYDEKKMYSIPKYMTTVLYMGYDKENFYINDPLQPETLTINRNLLEKSYDSYGRQGIYMYRGRDGLYK